MEKEESIILVWYFENQKVNQKRIIDFFEKINSDIFQKEIDEISYVNKKENEKSLKYCSKNVDKYLNEASDNDDGFELSSYLQNYKYKSVDLEFSACYNSRTEKQIISSIYIAINKKMFFEKFNYAGLRKIYIDISNFLLQEEIIITYGFIFSLENEKFPLMFVSGIGSFSLSDFEENSMMKWRKNRDKADKIIWDVFSGNLITTKHIKNNYSIQDLINIVGITNFFKMKDDLFYFNLPANSLKFGDQKNNMSRKLIKILNHTL